MKSRGYFFGWLLTLCVAVHLLILLIYATRLGPNESSENNGLGNLVALPDFGILGFLVIFLLFIFPRNLERSQWGLAGYFAVGYAILALILFRCPSLYGGYEAKFRIVDRSDHPLLGIRVDFLQQRSLEPGGFLRSCFFVQDFETDNYTDRNGIVTVSANIFTRLSGAINRSLSDMTPLDPKYQSSNFLITCDVRGSILDVTWERPSEVVDKGLRLDHQSNITVPFSDPQTIYLAVKDERGSYPASK